MRYLELAVTSPNTLEFGVFSFHAHDVLGNDDWKDGISGLSRQLTTEAREQRTGRDKLRYTTRTRETRAVYTGVQIRMRV